MTERHYTRRCRSAAMCALTLFLLATPVLAADGSIALRQHLTELVEQDRAPALFAAFINRRSVVFAEAVGVRRRGFSAKVTTNDLLRINSNTKAMTAMMVATLVQDGTFPNGWQTTIQDVFPELVKDIHESYHTVTLFELLSMQSGVKKHARNHGDYAYASIPDVVDRRYAFLREHFGEPPEHVRGKTKYSNLSMLMAAAMAERLTRTSWDALMRERLFKPLGMTKSGIGEPSQVAADQPWGHYHDRGYTWVSDQRPVPAVHGPAGSVYVTIDDWEKFIGQWFQGADLKVLDRRIQTELITPEPRKARYAGGWRLKRRKGRLNIIWHTGGSPTWRSFLAVYPRSGKAYLAVATGRDRDRPKTRKMLQSIVKFMRKQ